MFDTWDPLCLPLPLLTSRLHPSCLSPFPPLQWPWTRVACASLGTTACRTAPCRSSRPSPQHQPGVAATLTPVPCLWALPSLPSPRPALELALFSPLPSGRVSGGWIWSKPKKRLQMELTREPRGQPRCRTWVVSLLRVAAAVTEVEEGCPGLVCRGCRWPPCSFRVQGDASWAYQWRGG